jgi:hypothetical protein
MNEAVHQLFTAFFSSLESELCNSHVLQGVKLIWVDTCNARMVPWHVIENEVRAAQVAVNLADDQHPDTAAKVRNHVETIVLGIEQRRQTVGGFDAYIHCLRNERAQARVEARHERIRTEQRMEYTGAIEALEREIAVLNERMEEDTQQNRTRIRGLVRDKTHYQQQCRE